MSGEEKDFDGWNIKKKAVHHDGAPAFCHPREIWWCALGVNVGYEQDGTGKNFDRPVVVIRGFNERLFFGVALTGKKKAGKYYFSLGEVEGRESSAVLSQVRLIDTKRLIRKIVTLDEETFEKLRESLKNVLFP